MNEMLVTVIIPCFQQGHFLRQAIESVLEQSLRSIEVIVINDGSTDTTHSVAGSFGNDIVYKVQANAGVVRARNRGISLARGKYLVFLDADDMLHPRAIEKQIVAMADRTDRLCVMDHEDFIDVPNFESSVEEDGSKVVPSLPALIHRCPGPPVKIMAPADAVNRIQGFKLPTPGCADWDLWLRLALHSVSQLMIVPFKGAFYRKHDEAMSRNTSSMLRSRVDVFSNVHYGIASDTTSLSRFGCDLLDAELRVLRRFHAWKIRDEHYNILKGLAADLLRRGVKPSRSRLKSTVDRVFGLQSELVAVKIHRWLSPTYVDSLTRDIS